MEEKGHDSSFDVTKGSYDGEELCEWIGIYIQSLLESCLEMNQMNQIKSFVISITNKQAKCEKRSYVFLKVLTSKLKLPQI